jgi:CRP-like cAMP-binding protein
MVRLQSFRPSSDTHFAIEDGALSATAPHSPSQNQLLAALPSEDYERLLPKLEPVALPLGWAVHSAGDQEKYLYFLTAGIVSRFYVTQDGASAEFAVTGSEGVIGVASFLGGESTPSQAVVLSAGYAYRLRAELLKNEFKHDGPLPHLLLRYTQALIAQTGQIAVCNRHHSLEQRLCRWILSCLDRLPSNELTMTQELIADMLGVRREGVTQAAGKLQEAGLIHYSRGHIAVLDRPRLEAQACECYAAVKREYDRLLPEYSQGEVAS